MGASSAIAENLARVRERIERAARRAGRPADPVRVAAVTKGQPLDAVEALWEAGHRVYGENRIQEALPKIEGFPRDAEWHLIGHLQSNKARQAIRAFALIHSADSARILKALSKEAEKANLTLRLLLQVNVAREPRKFGCSPEDAPALFGLAETLPGIRLEGLMTMAPLTGGGEAARGAFAGLRALRDRLAGAGVAPERLGTLSMGMSDDFEIAVEEGANLVRIGRALFHPQAA